VIVMERLERCELLVAFSGRPGQYASGQVSAAIYEKPRSSGAQDASLVQQTMEMSFV